MLTETIIEDERWQQADLPALARLAKDFPDQPIVCDHVAMPLGISSFASERGWDGSVATEWREGITALAECPNVCVKLGGLTQPHAGFEFNRQAKPPSSEELAAAVGPCVPSPNKIS